MMASCDPSLYSTVELTAIATEFETNIYPQMAAATGGCAVCHAPGMGRNFTFYPGDSELRMLERITMSLIRVKEKLGKSPTGEALDQLIGGVLVAEMNGVDALVEQDWRLVTWVVDETAVGGSAAVRRLGHDDDPCHELSPFGSRMGSQPALPR